LLLTSRPQVEPWFDKWTTREKLDPHDERNQNDFKILLWKRLKDGQYVTQADLEAATSEILRMSEVMSLYVS
jgi:hypothetical protein